MRKRKKKKNKRKEEEDWCDDTSAHLNHTHCPPLGVGTGGGQQCRHQVRYVCVCVG